MFQDTRPAALDGDGDADRFAEFRVSEPVARLALLKDLMDRSVPINLNGSDGTCYTSTLWSVDGEQNKISFTADLDSPAVHRLVEADEAVAVGYIDLIKVQFDVLDRVLVHGRHACVLQASLPREVYRFQRRGAYRVRTLERHAPTASFAHPAIPDMKLALRVLDVSVGGCALYQPGNVPGLEPGVRLQRVRIELDGETEFHAAMQIQHITSIQSQSNGVRLGCELLNLDGAAQRALQRYIDQTQKRRRLMARD
jgi:c-di-GMP-binding flagellar brake protein YcgR